MPIYNSNAALGTIGDAEGAAMIVVITILILIIIIIMAIIISFSAALVLQTMLQE